MTANLETQTAGTDGAIRRYFRARWSGHVDLVTLTVRDMLIFGTLVNVTTTLISLGVLSTGFPGWSLAVFLSPVPYNLFLMLSVWRAGERRGGWQGLMACILSALWMLTASLI